MAEITYDEFCDRSKTLQAGYISGQRLAMHALDLSRLECGGGLAPDGRPLPAYKAGARALGFHPLTEAEIRARLTQLDQMEAEIEQTHGRDAPNMQVMFAFCCGGLAA